MWFRTRGKEREGETVHENRDKEMRKRERDGRMRKKTWKRKKGWVNEEEDGVGGEYGFEWNGIECLWY